MNPERHDELREHVGKPLEEDLDERRNQNHHQEQDDARERTNHNERNLLTCPKQRVLVVQFDCVR